MSALERLPDLLPGRRALVAVGCILALAVSHQLGVLRGSAPELAAAVPEAGPTLIDRETADLRLERDTARAMVATLTEELVVAKRQAEADAAELELYRRIGEDSTAGPRGLGIDTIELRDGLEGPELAITLVQARGRDRIAGQLGVSLLTGGAGTERQELVAVDGHGALTFDLRFFETLTLPIGELDVAPAGVAIEVVAAGGKPAPFVEIRDWDTILEERGVR